MNLKEATMKKYKLTEDEFMELVERNVDSSTAIEGIRVKKRKNNRRDKPWDSERQDF